MSNRPILVGVTGGIGAGKSVACEILSILDVPVYNADNRAKVLMVENKELVKEIKLLFGEESYDNGNLNRKAIAEKAFGNKEILEQLNELVHPKVAEDFNEWVNENINEAYVVKEAALLFESGSYKELDLIINVSAPEKLRVKRVLQRDNHRSKEQVKSIISQQMPEAEKNRMADFVVINDGEKMLLPQLLDLHRKIMKNKSNTN